jgi:hypothetical protein
VAVFNVLRVKVLEPRISWRAPAYGELWRIGDEAGAWMLGCPACGEPAMLDHDVLVVGDRATISPSVLCPMLSCRAHYHVVDGEVRPA